MPELLADVSDFVQRHGALETDQETVVAALLEDASGLILDEVEGSDAPWVQNPEEEDIPHSVKRVCISVAYRAWSNPDALSQMSMGNTALSYTREQTIDALFLTDDEQRRVHRAAKQASMRSVPVVSPWNSEGDEWLT